eukprot:3955969-Amphidinium_carterae.1
MALASKPSARVTSCGAHRLKVALTGRAIQTPIASTIARKGPGTIKMKVRESLSSEEARTI